MRQGVARANAEVAVAPGAAHAIHFDRPDESIALLRAWLRQQGDPTAE